MNLTTSMTAHQGRAGRGQAASRAHGAVRGGDSRDLDYSADHAAHVYPRATQSVPACGLIERLLERGVAYKGEDGSIYFAIASSRPTTAVATRHAGAQVGARVAATSTRRTTRAISRCGRRPSRRRSGRRAWDAPFGRGRPGWHLDAPRVARADREVLPHETLDFTPAAVELIFPHTKTRSAQSEGGHGEAVRPLSGCTANPERARHEDVEAVRNFLTARDLRDRGVEPRRCGLLYFGRRTYRKRSTSRRSARGGGCGGQAMGEFYARLGKGKGEGDAGVRRPWLPGFEADFRAASTTT